LGPEPGSDAHGLVGARVALACGRVAVASLLRRRGAVASTIAAAMVPASRCCCAVAVMLLASPSPPRCRIAVAPTPPPSRLRHGHRGHAVATATPLLRPSPPPRAHCRCVAVALLSRRRRAVAPCRLARPPYEGGACQICTLCGEGRCLVVVDGGARRIRTPRSANVGLDRASGHRARRSPGGDCCLVIGNGGFTTYARLAAIDAASSL